MTEASATGVVRPPLDAITADRLAFDLRKLAKIYPYADEERQALDDAARFLIRQAAALAEVRVAIGKD